MKQAQLYSDIWASKAETHYQAHNLVKTENVLSFQFSDNIFRYIKYWMSLLDGMNNTPNKQVLSKRTRKIENKR